jgi:hypothetical protein
MGNGSLGRRPVDGRFGVGGGEGGLGPGELRKHKAGVATVAVPLVGT